MAGRHIARGPGALRSRQGGWSRAAYSGMAAAPWEPATIPDVCSCAVPADRSRLRDGAGSDRHGSGHRRESPVAATG